MSSTGSPVVTVLFSSPDGDGSFTSAVSVATGKTLRGIVTADYNGDGVTDIVVADRTPQRVFLILANKVGGKGNGTFKKPVSFSASGGYPVDVATGYLDCPLGCSDPTKAGPDLVTSNAIHRLSLWFNLGGDKGFEALSRVPVGPSPRSIEVADFNGDGADDIAVLITGRAGADTVSVFLNNGVGAFWSVTPVDYTVSVGASHMTVGDFDHDGVPDIAVINNGGAKTRRSISILLNQTIKSPNGTVQGTGLFKVLPAFGITCPTRVTGVPITCTPQDIVSADFDGDSFDDLAVSFSTTATDTSSVYAGVINVYTGRGHGQFDFATQLNVGLGPRRIVPGEFTGDGVLDLAVTEYSSNTARILRGVAPPPKPPGWACNLGGQCQTGFCTDNVCCNSSSCPSGEFCNIPGSLGTCSPPGPDGITCDSAEQCQSGYCVDGFCCSTASCPNGEFCTNDGQCAGPAGPGTPCSADEQCASGYCVDGVCCESGTCANNEACNIPGSEGQCAALVPPGNPCAESSQCDTGFCADGVCCYSEWCPAGQACNLPGSLGSCTYLPTPTPTPTRTPTITRTPTPTLTPTPVPIGGPCSAGITLCDPPNLCIDGICCSTACTSGQYCNITNFVGTCHVQLPDTSPCGKNSDCVSGYCAPSGKCAPAPTSTPTPTPTPLSPGDSCWASSQCPSPLVCSTDEGVCCLSSQCPSGQSCQVPGHLGRCTPIPTATATVTPTATDTPTPTITPTPCDEASCETQGQGWRCDITGYVGTCSPPLGLDEGPCSKNTDCEAALICNPNTGLCDYIQTPTPPPLDTPTVITCPPGMVLQGNVCTEVSRSGGCSIGDPGARNTAASSTSAAGTETWLLAVFPLALGIRRLRRQYARAK